MTAGAIILVSWGRRSAGPRLARGLPKLGISELRGAWSDEALLGVEGRVWSASLRRRSLWRIETHE